MGFFDKMKLAVGIGGAKVEITLNSGAVPRGGFVRGQVVLRGGKASQTCNGIEARLERIQIVRTQVEGKTQEREQVEPVDTKTWNEGGFEISDGLARSWDFAFQVPPGGDARTRFRVYATADIPGAIDPSAHLDVPTTEGSAMPTSAAEAILTAQTWREQAGDHGPQIESALKQAIALEPTNSQAMRMLAEQVGQRNEAEATVYWRSYLELVPTDADAWYWLAANADRRGAKAEALDACARAVALAPDSSDKHSYQAELFANLQRYDEAIAAYDAAIRCDPRSDGNAMARAEVLGKVGRTQEAVAALLAVAEKGEWYRVTELIDILTRLGAAQHADDVFALAFKANAASPYEVHDMHAKHLFALGQHEAAIAAVDQATQGSNLSVWTVSTLLVLKGKSLEALQRKPEAKAAYQRALELNKDDAEAGSRFAAL